MSIGQHNQKLTTSPKASSALSDAQQLAGLSPFMPITLTQGKVALVDKADYVWLNQWKWYVRKDRKRYFYATRMVYTLDKWTQIQMHRFIMNAPAHLHVDHINFDTLDNRRQNLRLCTSGQNTSSQRPQHKTTASIYKGVWFIKEVKRWRAGIQYHYKKIHLGCFVDEIEAAKAYDQAAKKYFGEFAITNFP